MEELAKETIKKATEGDKAAFNRVITAYKRCVFEVCFRYMRNEQEALDMAQETFVRAYTAIRSFKGDSKMSTWLYRIAVNCCINRLDMLKRRKDTNAESIYGDEETDHAPLQIADTRRRQDELLSAGSETQTVHEALNELDDADRNVLVLREIQGMEYEEIAQILKMPVGSVKSRLSRARDKLKAKLIRKAGE